MEQLLIHLFGDFFLQTDAQALNKKKNNLYGFRMCLTHCLTYSLPFLLIASWQAVIIIGLTHFLIDRWHFTEYIIAIKNRTLKEECNFKKLKIKEMLIIGITVAIGCFVAIKFKNKLEKKEGKNLISLFYDISNFGYAPNRPFAISVWLMIITDNTFHLIINYFAIKYL